MAEKEELLHAENRTDLALEAGERLRNENVVPKGLRVETLNVEQADAEITRVYVESEEAARRMGKPMGVYITIEASSLAGEDKAYHQEISALLCRQIRGFLPACKGREELLVVGLGNRAVTADALGPRAIDHLAVNRHLLALYGVKSTASGDNDCVTVLSAIEPGVMAKTGIETAEVVASITDRLKPDAVLVLDSLAAGSVSRLYSTIQISNTGIAPGSGVGNHRSAINQETLGVPVIAVGIPMVVDAATIVRDAVRSAGDSGRSDEGRRVDSQKRDCRRDWDNSDRVRGGSVSPNLSLEEFRNMYVTTKEIDEMTERLSFTLSEAINALTG
ncbi:MAG: GPR endopeptidase [Lachnospiraceae bacterium]|nr:GPR endopeptidase [Lachnospiraceae bacterium]